MSHGVVYRWLRDPAVFTGGRLVKDRVTLLRLQPLSGGNSCANLTGAYVGVRNGGSIYMPDEEGEPRAVPIGNATPNSNGDYPYEPHRGGGRLDKVALAKPEHRDRYVESSHFGEVNTYYHVDLIASYVGDLLRELDAPQLPRVEVVVNAHHAATEQGGMRDGVRGRNRWLPFQGGHYRLPSHRHDIPEHEPLAPDGEIHLGPGWRLSEYGALAVLAGAKYRANASHNAGIIYHEYGHHIARHTADFRGNRLLPPTGQDNLKAAIDEGTCDYWAAAMLGTPHLWAWHHRHDAQVIHPRSLANYKTTAHYDSAPGADPHANGTIWGGALWDLRNRVLTEGFAGGHRVDRLVLKAMLLLADVYGGGTPSPVESVRRERATFAMGLAALLEADKQLHAGFHRGVIIQCFAARGIEPGRYSPGQRPAIAAPLPTQVIRDGLRVELKGVPSEEIPPTEDLHSAMSMQTMLDEAAESPASLIVGGDVMLGGRMRRVIAENGPDYPFAVVRPLLRHASAAMANLEGPLARKSNKVDRTYSYRVNPNLAPTLTQAGLSVMTLANNHLMDCGPGGVVETLASLADAGISALGAGVNTQAAHRPVIFTDGRGLRIGLLAYYWNFRCAAMPDSPGGAMDLPERLEADIQRLREETDRIVVTFHWGIPYEIEPSPSDRNKARFAIDCGADVVVAHHPHVLQPIELYRGCPIFYSVGNFAFGSGNSRAEGMLVAIRFEEQGTVAHLYPLYVKNRDPRVNYQPKVMRGESARRALHRLWEASESIGAQMSIDNLRGTLQCRNMESLVATRLETNV